MERPTDKQIADVLAGVASVEEAKMVARWFATEAGSAYLASSFDKDARSISLGDEDLYVSHSIPSREVWIRIQKQIRRYRLRHIIFRAAVVVIPLLLLVGMYVQLDERVSLFGEAKYEEVYVPKGERIQIMFQDGSKVYINSDTYLRYPEKFGIKSREVELSGEAYFVVAPNKSRPFIVHLGGPSIQVVGTSFNVQNYPDDDRVTVCLDEGTINMHLVSEEEVPLRPGQRVVYDKKHDACQVMFGDNVRYLSLWKENIIAFKDASLSEVITKLQRWYNVNFEIEKNVSQDLLITLTSDQTILENVLLDLEKITPMKFEYDEKLKRVWVHL